MHYSQELKDSRNFKQEAMLTEEEWEAIVEKRQKERKARMEAQVGRAKAKVKCALRYGRVSFTYT